MQTVIDNIKEICSMHAIKLEVTTKEYLDEC